MKKNAKDIGGIGMNIHNMLKNQGKLIVNRNPLAFVPNIGWHCHLIPDLEKLGTVTLFDYVSQSYSWEKFAKADKIGISRRKEMNEKILPALRRFSRIWHAPNLLLLRWTARWQGLLQRLELACNKKLVRLVYLGWWALLIIIGLFTGRISSCCDEVIYAPKT